VIGKFELSAQTGKINEELKKGAERQRMTSQRVADAENVDYVAAARGAETGKERRRGIRTFKKRPTGVRIGKSGRKKGKRPANQT